MPPHSTITVPPSTTTIFSSQTLPPPSPTLFPYTTLFRSGQYLCECDCGRTRIVKTGHFNAGNAKSCGCHKNLRPVRTEPPWKAEDRKSTRLNSSHVKISYAVFCLKKKKKQS